MVAPMVAVAARSNILANTLPTMFQQYYRSMRETETAALYIFEFINVDGGKREIIDDDRNVQRLVEPDKHGSGTKVQPSMTHDHTTDGLPPTNLRTVMVWIGVQC